MYTNRYIYCAYHIETNCVITITYVNNLRVTHKKCLAFNIF